MSIFTHSKINFNWMYELGATITWSIKFQLDEVAFVEGSSDLCDDKFGLYWDGRERNVRNCTAKLGRRTLSIHLACGRAEIRHLVLDTGDLRQLDLKQDKRGCVTQFPLTLVSSCHVIDICRCSKSYLCDSCSFGDTGYLFTVVLVVERFHPS